MLRSLVVNTITTKLVDKVWDGMRLAVTQELKLYQEPLLQYHNVPEDLNKNHCVMYVVYSANAKGFGHMKMLSHTRADYVIHINVGLLGTMLGKAKEITKSSESVERIVRFLLYHECRHLWQAQVGFYDGMQKNVISSQMPYRIPNEFKSEEEDANAYAKYKAYGVPYETETLERYQRIVMAYPVRSKHRLQIKELRILYFKDTKTYRFFKDLAVFIKEWN